MSKNKSHSRTSMFRVKSVESRASLKNAMAATAAFLLFNHWIRHLVPHLVYCSFRFAIPPLYLPILLFSRRNTFFVPYLLFSSDILIRGGTIS